MDVSEALIFSNKCNFQAVDLDAIVRLSNEFKFPVASLHHAGQTYLVPELLKKTWVCHSNLDAIFSDFPKGGVPSIALFASNARKKREAYRNSEFAPKILADNGIPVIMKVTQFSYYSQDSVIEILPLVRPPSAQQPVPHV
ncbi:hypothetical protein C0993_003786 [Termitomyces sp. T159_Od127]|nr:hypothetical protein C0993_003786 [Termitomyces sp. T159_Od127]